MKLICSTFHPSCCSVTPRVRLRDTSWSSTRDRAQVRYWSVTSLMRLNSRMHRVPTLVLVGSLNARSSGLSLQNLVCATDSLDWSAAICFSSDCVKGRLVSRSLAVFQMESAVIMTPNEFYYWLHTIPEVCPEITYSIVSPKHDTFEGPMKVLLSLH